MIPPLQGLTALALSTYSGQALCQRLHTHRLFRGHNTPTIHITNVETEVRLKKQKKKTPFSIPPCIQTPLQSDFAAAALEGPCASPQLQSAGQLALATALLGVVSCQIAA